jgi:hypothetical protein
MARRRNKIVISEADRALARSPVLWLAIGLAGVMVVFFGWLFSLAFSA